MALTRSRPDSGLNLSNGSFGRTGLSSRTWDWSGVHPDWGIGRDGLLVPGITLDGEDCSGLLQEYGRRKTLRLSIEVKGLLFCLRVPLLRPTGYGASTTRSGA